MCKTPSLVLLKRKHSTITSMFTAATCNCKNKCINGYGSSLVSLIPLTAVHASLSVLCLESSSGVTRSILPPTPARSCSFSQIRFHSNKLYPGCFCVSKLPAACFSAKLWVWAAEGSDKVEEEAPMEVAGCPLLVEVSESSCSVVMDTKQHYEHNWRQMDLEGIFSHETRHGN